MYPDDRVVAGFFRGEFPRFKQSGRIVCTADKACGTQRSGHLFWSIAGKIFDRRAVVGIVSLSEHELYVKPRRQRSHCCLYIAGPLAHRRRRIHDDYYSLQVARSALLDGLLDHEPTCLKRILTPHLLQVPSVEPNGRAWLGKVSVANRSTQHISTRKRALRHE